MVFEQAYGKWLADELDKRIKQIDGDISCKLFDEVCYRPLYDNPDAIALIISGGNAGRPEVEGQDRNVLPLTVTVICREKYSAIVRNAIDDLQNEFNAVQLECEVYDLFADGEEKDVDGFKYRDCAEKVKFKSVFSTPFLFDESDITTRNETVKAAFISFSASVIYGKTAVLNPATVQIQIADNIYDLKYIADCNAAAMPSYEAFLPQGEERLEQIEISRAGAFSYTIYKVAGDNLQKIFDEELNCVAGGGLHGKKIKLITGGNSIEIKTFQLSEEFAGNAAVYSLTLGV